MSYARAALAWLFTGGLIAIASPVEATDGVLEINQTCAVSTGCFTGDAAGWPVTIDGSAGRSYRLTGDLVLPDQNTNGVYVSASSVSVDLNGFEIILAACVGATSSACRPTSGSTSATGIRVDGSGTRYGISVRNGSITGMGSYGVFLGRESRVNDLRVRWNRVIGIYAGEGSTVSGNAAYENGDSGIVVGQGSTISGNTVYANGQVGIYTYDGATVSGNTVYLNGSSGIHALSGAMVSDNTVYQNGGVGIEVNGGSVVRGNAVTANMGEGLTCVQDGEMCAYSENAFAGNQAGSVSGGELRATGGNACADQQCASSRRFYLTTTTHNGAQALDACADGYHMASLWELWDPSRLHYDTALGEVFADSGSGPPSAYSGWIRTGYDSWTTGLDGGQANCAAWTSSDGAQHGTVTYLVQDWNAASSESSPWGAPTPTCDVLARVWCIQN